MPFKQLNLHDWQHIASLDIAFHKHLTVLTGANGSGKTTILRFLARHFGGWSFLYLRTPKSSVPKGGLNIVEQIRPVELLKVALGPQQGPWDWVSPQRR